MMSPDVVQLLTDVVLLFTALSGLGTAVVVTLRMAKKVDNTAAEVHESGEKLNVVHQLVDGNLSKIQEQLAHALDEIADLKEQRAAASAGAASTPRPD
jgi:hypothetical protein